MKKLVIVVVCLWAGGAFVVIVGFFGLGIAASTYLIPDTCAVRGERLHGGQLEFLREEGLLPPGEEIVWFYSDGFLSIESDGNFFTEERVVSYWEEADGNLMACSAPWPEIAALDVEYSASWTENSILSVSTHDGGEFQLWVSTDDGLDEVFFQELQGRWSASGKQALVGNPTPR